MINQYFIPENETIIKNLKKELLRLRQQYSCPPNLNIRKKESWTYQKRVKPLE